MKHTRKCPDCGGGDIYTTKVSARGAGAPDLLPGAHPWWRGGKMEVYICGGCGHFQFYVPRQDLDEVRESSRFRRYD